MTCPNCGHVIDPPRNRGQQGRLHALLSQWARYEGVTLEEKKIEAKVGFGCYAPWAAIESGRMELPQWPNRIVDLADIYISYPRGSYALVQSESSFTRSQESQFIQWVESRMMDAHIPTEDI